MAWEAFDGFHVARAFLNHLPLKCSTSPIDFDELRSTDIQDSDFCINFIGHLLKAGMAILFFWATILFRIFSMKKEVEEKS